MADYPKRHRINLTAKGIDDEIALLWEQKRKLRDNAYEHLCELAEFAYEELVTRIPRDTGELVSTVYCTVDANTLTLRIGVGSDHALYVEFGTGIRGIESPHPDESWLDEVGWDYNSMTSEHIYLMSDGEPGWFYPSDDGRWVPTHGQLSRHYFYDTIMEIIAEGRRKGVELVYR